MDRSSKRTRDDRDRDRDHHKHRSRDDKHRDSSDSHHHRSERESHHRDHHKSSRRDDTKRERSREREESVDRRERSHDHKSSSSSRREDRERSYDAREEREGSRERKREKREREIEEEDYFERKKRKERGGSEDRVVVDKEKRSRRRFGEKVKEEDNSIDTNNNGNSFENVKSVDLSEVRVKEEVNGQPTGGGSGSTTENGGVSTANGSTLATFTKTPSNLPETSVTPVHPLPTKVSSISNTNENKGVSIARSHEVPGKSSTDGTTSAAGKSGNLSLDALAKAKKALQMQKELSEKLKKLPLSSKGNKSSGGGLQGPLSSATITTAVSVEAMPSSSTSSTSTMVSVKPPATGMAPPPDITSMPNYEAVKRAQELAAKMGFRQDPEFAPLINFFPGQLPAEVSALQKPSKAPVLRVDALGREIDEHGNVVNVTKPNNLSTLKVNINKQKKEAFQILKPELDVDPESNPYFDAKMGINKNKFLRPKRMTFQFVEEGKWLKEAEIMKLRNQFGEEREKDMKARQALHAKAKAAPDINPNLIEVSERVTTKAKPKDPIPDIEWWDVPLLTSGTYGEDVDDLTTQRRLKMEKITIYVEHPRPIEPPAEPAPPPPQPLKLTKKEQKKLRTQRRLAREKDRQEMIRQGLIEPPKPKVKMSNLMKVLGSEATQDPTRLEKEIRTAAAEREQAHIDRNTARKLTPAERREKKERKLFDDPNTVETIVSIYRINDLSDKKTRFKVDVNAHENRLTGCTVITEGICVVVVEGGSKSIKRYGKLMLRRINWAEAVNEDEGGDNDEKPMNKCVLVWQGSVAKPNFHRFSLHECVTEAAARKYFADAGVAHYWDLAVNFSDDQM
ncbi:protein RDM16-like isoform X1 [Populus nigra]|uniref:protein RDM16-like isoform X1 n=2 Tax=Populus nigra TaxID=3691 RepID=UPI002B271A86|nr:protein RDM16-like isoform X1 [Populus nigra]